jgi:hypothetical protein
LLKVSYGSGDSLRADIDQEGQQRSVQASDLPIATRRTPE